jgi:hypothetical protein
MKRLIGLVISAVLIAGSGAALAQQSNTNSATQDLKSAGHSTKEAGKSTGKAVKKGTKKGVNKTAKETKKGANKIEGKTNDTTR